MVAAVLLGASSTAAAMDFDLGGRVQEHSSWFSGSGKKTNAGVNQFTNGANLRRADLFAKGSLGRDDLSFYAHYNFAGVAAGESHIQRAYVQWKCDNFHVRVGQQYMPFGMAHTSSSSNLMFMERSEASEVATTRRWFGANAGMMMDMFTLNLSVATRGLEEANNYNNSDKYAYLVRATAAPMQGDEGTLHIGVDYKHRKFNTENTAGVGQAVAFTVGTSTELRNREGITDVVSLTSAGNGTIKTRTAYALELAGQYEGLTVQGEYFNQTYKFTSTDSQQKVKSWYVEAGYVLTGEHRTYSQSAGVFKDPKPAGDNGAWEVAARYTSVDMTRNGNNTNGGKAKTMTLGANWFLTDQLKLQANWTRTKFSFAPDATADRKVSGLGLGMQFLF